MQILGYKMHPKFWADFWSNKDIFFVENGAPYK